jgi:hypothetical protein
MSAAEDALAPARRHQHILPDGRVAYEWSQSLNDVTVLVATVPEGVRGRDLDVCIERGRCRLGLRGNPPYLDVSVFVSFSFGREAMRKTVFVFVWWETERERRSEASVRAVKRFNVSSTTTTTTSVTTDARSKKKRRQQNRSRRSGFSLLLHSTKLAARDLQRRQGLRILLDAR